MERRLAAILAADVVGYSRLMGEDEAGTLDMLKALRKELVAPEISKHRGRVVKLMGDGLLAEFGSVVEAVACAVAIQTSLMVRNERKVPERQVVLRIGINLGDVIVEGRDIYGDGVNVAARLEGLAEPGGICISGDAYRQVRGKLDVNFDDLGERQVKNIVEPLRVYSVAFATIESGSRDVAGLRNDATDPKALAAHGSNDGVEADASIEIDLSLPDYPSIAVLPFTNMSSDVEQEYFSDGIAEDIITALSKISSLLVVARNSTFTYKGKAVDVKEVSREQGVRYVLEGSVRKSAKRARVTAQLIDATTGHHLWAEHYDRDLEDIFAVQDEITQKVVIALDVHLREGEQARLWSSGTKNLEAWECIRLGMDCLNRIAPETRMEAFRLLKRAIDLDPNYAIAWVMLGWAYFHEADVGTAYDVKDRREAFLKQCSECAPKALELDPNCADAYALSGMCQLSMGKHEQAVTMSEKAVALAPSLAENLALSAAILVKSGQPEKAFDRIRKAMRLCPIYPSWYVWILGTACRLTGRDDTAVRAFKEAIRRSPDYPAPHVSLTSTLADLGREDEAKKSANKLLRILPEFSISDYMGGLHYKYPTDAERFEAGLRKAGLPE